MHTVQTGAVEQSATPALLKFLDARTDDLTVKPSTQVDESGARDLVNRIPGLYRLLDLHSEIGSGGSGVVLDPVQI